MPLDTLVINGTRVSDVSPLAPVVTLKHLFAENTAVRDWKPLAGLVAKGLVIPQGRPISRGQGRGPARSRAPTAAKAMPSASDGARSLSARKIATSRPVGAPA